MSFNFSKENLIETEKGKTLFVYWIKRIFIDDWLMKLVALLITLSLWLGVTGLQKTVSRTLSNVALNPLLAKDLEITNDFVTEIDIEVTGDKNKVDNINPRDLVVTFDVTDLDAGDRESQLTSQNINVELPPGVTITRIIPETVNLRIESVKEAEIPVRESTKGKLVDGYEVYSTKIIPETVRIRGPQSFVESLNFVPTEKIDLNGRRGDFVAKKVPIDTSEAEKISLVDSVTATIVFKIGKKRIERLFVVPYETENRTGNASVLLYGSNTLLENLSSDDIRIVEIEETSSKLRVILPEAIRNEVEIRNIKYRE